MAEVDLVNRGCVIYSDPSFLTIKRQKNACGLGNSSKSKLEGG